MSASRVSANHTSSISQPKAGRPACGFLKTALKVAAFVGAGLLVLPYWTQKPYECNSGNVLGIIPWTEVNLPGGRTLPLYNDCPKPQENQGGQQTQGAADPNPRSFSNGTGSNLPVGSQSHSVAAYVEDLMSRESSLAEARVDDSSLYHDGEASPSNGTSPNPNYRAPSQAVVTVSSSLSNPFSVSTANHPNGNAAPRDAAIRSTESFDSAGARQAVSSNVNPSEASQTAVSTQVEVSAGTSPNPNYRAPSQAVATVPSSLSEPFQIASRMPRMNVAETVSASLVITAITAVVQGLSSVFAGVGCWRAKSLLRRSAAEDEVIARSHQQTAAAIRAGRLQDLIDEAKSFGLSQTEEFKAVEKLVSQNREPNQSNVHTDPVIEQLERVVRRAWQEKHFATYKSNERLNRQLDAQHQSGEPLSLEEKSFNSNGSRPDSSRILSGGKANSMATPSAVSNKRVERLEKGVKKLKTDTENLCGDMQELTKKIIQAQNTVKGALEVFSTPIKPKASPNNLDDNSRSAFASSTPSPNSDENKSNSNVKRRLDFSSIEGPLKTLEKFDNAKAHENGASPIASRAIPAATSGINAPSQQSRNEKPSFARSTESSRAKRFTEDAVVRGKENKDPVQTSMSSKGNASSQSKRKTPSFARGTVSSKAKAKRSSTTPNGKKVSPWSGSDKISGNRPR